MCSFRRNISRVRVAFFVRLCISFVSYFVCGLRVSAGVMKLCRTLGIALAYFALEAGVGSFVTSPALSSRCRCFCQAYAISLLLESGDACYWSCILNPPIYLLALPFFFSYLSCAFSFTRPPRL